MKRLFSVLMIFAVFCCGFSVSAAGSGNGYPNTHKNTGDQRVDIVSIAKTQIGYREGDNNDTKYGTWYGLPNQPWCAMFVSWCARQAKVPLDILRNCAIAAPYYGYFDIPYYDGEEYTPKQGDLFFTKTFSHVGLVDYVDGEYFYTVEGNTNDTGSSTGIGVFSLRRTLKDYYFGVPDYNYISENHTCEKDIFVRYNEDHPHSAVYRCSVCAALIEDKNTTGKVDSCVYCSAPEKPVIECFTDPFLGENAVTFHWEEVADATYYDFTLERMDSHGNWQESETVYGASHGFTLRLSEGRYRAMLTAFNARYKDEAFPDGLYTKSDYKEFSIGKVLYTITYSDGENQQVQIKQQGLDCVLGADEPVREGFAFLGWSTVSNSKKPDYITGEFYRSDASVVLYPVWQDTSLKLRLGDVNEDEVVNIKDATAIQKHLAEMSMISQAGLSVSDTDQNGSLNIKDATAIQKYLAGITTGFPIGELYI